MAYEKHTWTAPELITKEKLNNIEDGISEAIAKAAEAADGVFVQTALSVSVNDENRAVIYNSGITISISGYNASDYVDISGWYAVMYKQIKIPYNANTGIAFYSDADEQNYLSGVNCAVNRDSLGYVGLDIAVVPEGAKYVRFTMLPTDTYGAFEAYGVTRGFCELNEKQDKLTFDDSPTASSDNPVKSGGIKSQLDILSQNMQDFYDSAMDAVRNSEMTLNLELSQKQDTLTFDTTPTAGSDNPVKSSGIKTAIDGLGTEVDDLKSAIGIPAEEKTAMFEQGTLNSSTGLPESRSDRIRTMNFIPTDGVTEIGITDTSTYFFTILWYDAEENFLSSTGWVSGASYEGTTGSFFRVVIGKNDSISPSVNTGFYYMAVPSVSEVLEALEDSIGGEIDRIDRMINIPDEEKTAVFEQGTIDSATGQNEANSGRIRTQQHIPCDGVTEIGVGDRTTYFFSILWYDAEKNYLSSTGWVSGATYEGTTGSFFRVVIGKNGGTISLSDDTGFHYVVTPTVSEALETLEDAVSATNDAVSATNDAVEALADTVAMPEQTMAPRLEQGTIDGGTGQDGSNTKRLRTVGYISAEGVTEIGTTNFAGYGYTILWYDENNGFIRATGWHQAAYDREIQGAYFRVVMAKRPDGVMSPTEDTGLYYKVSGKAINTVVEANTAKIENLAADDRVSINIIKQKWSPDDMQSGCCFVGNDLWQFYPGADDGSSTANVYVVAYDFEANTLTHVKTMTHNLGHVNSVAYCADTDTLICGNGSGDYTLSGKIFIMEDLSQRTELNRNDCIVIDVGMDFGYKVNAVWGESNAGRNDIVYLCTDDSHSIYRLQLGKGSNNLGSGTLISGTEGFNGTYKVTHSWHWGTLDAAGHDYANCVQGMVFWKNRLVWGYGHNNGLSMRAATLYAGGKLKIDGANYETLSASGTLAAKYMCGMTKFGPYGEYLGICASHTLWVVKDWD